VPSPLPRSFTLEQALALGWTKRAVYDLRDRGQLQVLGRGLYRRRDAELADMDLVEVALRSAKATLCLTSALAKHDLTDAIPAAHELAVPRGTRAPAVSARVRWHLFDAATFELGREALKLDAELSIGLYSAERSIVDAFRMRAQEGHELANEALKRWLRRRGAQPTALLKIAALLPRSEAPLRHALEVLL
jgi:predicted transcriptional regulator of viral defense system